MLHELLLALSGHPSPLLTEFEDELQNGPFRSHLAPAESALLQSLAKNLGVRHREIRDRASRINSNHSSIVCRAVTTSVTSRQLAAFQKAILDVEEDILEEDPSIVGAYKIVPLAGVVEAFDGWSRKLEWLLSLVEFIDPPVGSGRVNQKQLSCTANQLMAWLRESTHTGYPDIEQLSFELVKVAETAWLKQISAWLLYGRLPTLGAADFFVYNENGNEQEKLEDVYSIDHRLVPTFVTQATTNSILFIGKSLNHIRDRASAVRDSISNPRSPEMSLLPSHLAYLSSLEFPISTTSFSAAISAIRLSLSRNALQKLLPLSRVLETLRVLRNFFLLGRGEFAIALITAADQRLSTRQSRFADKLPAKAADGLRSAIIKEGEVSAVLARTWAAIASLQSVDDEDEDEDLELARDLISLSIRSLDPVYPTNESPAVPSFDDLLLPTPTALGLKVTSPLDLFLTSSDVDTYSRIHAYLLSIRRAHLRLSKLFLLSVLRRDHPSPKAPPKKSENEQHEAVARMRERASQRSKTLRPVWATIRSASFLLTEVGEYFQGEVVQTSWEAFHTWLDPNSEDKGSWPGPASSAEPLQGVLAASTASQRSIQSREPALHDPESLTVAHRVYLSSLTHALLLDHAHFTSGLRVFMTSIDYLSALMARLDSVYQHLDLESALGPVDTFTNYAVEEREVMRELGSAREKVASGVRLLVTSLRDIDAARASSNTQRVDVHVEGEDFYTPQTGGGLDRLLLKLDFADLQWGAHIGLL